MSDTLDYEIHQEHILFGQEPETKEGVIRALVHLLHLSGDLEEEETVISEVMERETIRPTGLSAGVACPHAKSGAVHTVKVAIARVGKGIDFGAVDGIPATHIFLILSPKTNDGKPHIQALSSIVKCYHNPDLLEKLNNAGSAEEYFDSLQSCYD